MEFRNIRARLRTYGMPPEVGDRAAGTLALAANWLSSWVWWMCYYSKNSSETKWNQVTACDCGLSCLQGLLRKKKKNFNCFLLFSSVASDSLPPHGLQHTRPPCPYQLLEFTQTHVHQVSDAIQPSHPLMSPSPTTFNLSQHQGLFQWVSSSHQVAKVLEFQLQHQSSQWIFRSDFL